MVKTTLVERDLEEGRRLLERLDVKEAETAVAPSKRRAAVPPGSKVPVQAAFWWYLPESQEWRLIIATPLVDSSGPLSVYTKIQARLSTIKPPSTLTAQNISAISPKDERVKMLRKAMKVVSGSSQGRFNRKTASGIYIDDAYIYRLQ